MATYAYDDHQHQYLHQCQMPEIILHEHAYRPCPAQALLRSCTCTLAGISTRRYDNMSTPTPLHRSCQLFSVINSSQYSNTRLHLTHTEAFAGAVIPSLGLDFRALASRPFRRYIRDPQLPAVNARHNHPAQTLFNMPMMCSAVESQSTSPH